LLRGANLPAGRQGQKFNFAPKTCPVVSFALLLGFFFGGKFFFKFLILLFFFFLKYPNKFYIFY